MTETTLRKRVAELYRAIEAGDREGVAALVADELRVEGFMDGAWVVWDREAYLGRVSAFREWIGEPPRGALLAIDCNEGHAIVDGSLRWSRGGFLDTLVFAHNGEEWLLRHKSFRACPPAEALVELYTAKGPNGYKVSIALEELGIPYRVHVVDLGRGEQFASPMRELNPNGKVPVIVDRRAGQTIFESNAILIHLADRAGGLLAPRGPARSEALQWLFFQAASLGPMLGQRGYFEAVAASPCADAIARYRKESERLFDVLEHRIRGREWILERYSIVDISCFTWLYCARAYGIFFEKDRPALRGWFHRIAAREAVQRGLGIPEPFPLAENSQPRGCTPG